VRTRVFLLISIAVAAAVFFAARLVNNDYVFFAGYTVLQFIVLATAWNILGGYTGYVNFGSAAFFALGAYSTVFLHKFYPMPIPVLIAVGGIVSGIVGLGMGYLTLRLRGAFFAIATLALAVVLQTLVVNWDYVGGSRGAYIIRPNEIALIGPYVQYLFLLMLALAVIALAIARGIERSQLGYGFATIRDDELAAEASGVPTLRLKLIATTISGALMGMAGAPFPYYIGYLQPSSAFGLEYAVNSIAMPMIGGTTSWVGPLIGAILLGLLQQLATVTISSAVNLLIVGVMLVAFVIVAPNGIVGLVQEFLHRAGVHTRSIAIIIVAAYLFVGGIGGIIWSLKLTLGSGVVLFILAALCIAAAYGLLMLEAWGLWLGIFLFAISIPLGLAQLLMGGMSTLAMLQIAIGIVVTWFLLRAEVKLLYRQQKVAAS
jgi:branched-chain amino acid transport system permease protein